MKTAGTFIMALVPKAHRSRLGMTVFNPELIVLVPVVRKYVLISSPHAIRSRPRSQETFS